MKLLLYKDQAKIFKSMVEIIKVLATVEGVEATDAISDLYAIANTIGGREMVKMLRGGTGVKTVTNGAMMNWSKGEMLEYIRVLEEIVGEDYEKEIEE